MHNSPSKKYDSVVPVPVITVKKEANPASGSYVFRGDTILYSISVTNVGMAPITHVVITDVIDPNLDNIVPEDEGTYDEYSRTITWPSVPFLGPGESISVQFWADAEPVELPLHGPLDIFNFATISSPDLPTDINTNTTVHTVIPTPLIDIEKTPDYQEVLTGSTVTFTITVTNTGDVDLTNVVVNDPNAPGCNLEIGPLGAGQSTSYECMVTVTEDLYNVPTATGTPPFGPDVTDNDDASVTIISPNIDIEKFTMVQVLPSNTCSTFGKPQVLTMLYTGDGPEATSNSQDPGKVSVEGDPNDADPVYITVASKQDLSDSKTKIYLQNVVIPLGETVEIDANVVGKTRLEATTYVFVKDQAGNLLQTVMFHTSCSQPLILGDQFGSIQLVGFISE